MNEETQIEPGRPAFEELAAKNPPLRLKIFFWLILACLSAFFAEVMVAYQYPYTTAWGILVILPLYGLHTLILAHIVFYYGKPRLYTLYLAGVIFGLYEAYITKVLWKPDWHAFWTVGGVAVLEILVIALWWHPFMAFILPVAVGETQFTHSRLALEGLPRRARGILSDPRRRLRALMLFAFVMGLVNSANSPSPAQSFLSILSSFGILLLLGWLWHRWTRGATYTMRLLLPNRREAILLSIPLLGLYLLTGFKLKPEALPGLGPQALIWLMYGFLGAALIVSLRKSRLLESDEELGHAVRIHWRPLALAAALLAASSAMARGLLSNRALLFLLFLWLFATPTGLWMLYSSIKDVAAKTKTG